MKVSRKWSNLKVPRFHDALFFEQMQSAGWKEKDAKCWFENKQNLDKTLFKIDLKLSKFQQLEAL